MPKISAPLTDTLIKNLKPKNKIYKKSDGQSLYLFVAPNGRKYFALEYKSPQTFKIKRVALGAYPALSLAGARAKRAEILATLANGVEPCEEKRGKDIYSVALEWLEIKAHKILPETLESQKRLLENNIKPYLSAKPMKALTALDIIDALKIIERKGSLEILRKTYTLLNQTYKYAVAYQIAAHNVMADIDFKYTFATRPARHFPTITDKGELKTFMTAIDEYKGDERTRVALRLAMLTALRPANVRKLEWSEVDLKNKFIKISASKMKMREAFELPLSTQAVSLLADFGKLYFGSKYVFPSTRSSLEPMSENTLNAGLRRLGYTKDEIVSHGFRATFSTIANEYSNLHGFSSDVIEKCLAHGEKNKVRAAYNHAKNLDEMRGLMQWYADFLESIKKG